MLAKKINDFITKHTLISNEERVLVAYSGGPDSTALLVLLNEIYQNVGAVYVNHQLRGNRIKKGRRVRSRFL